MICASPLSLKNQNMIHKTTRITLKQLTRLVTVLVFLFPNHSLSSQCFITYSGNACQGLPIQFNCNSVGAQQIIWDFNGEGSSSDCEPMFQFVNPGQKTVKLSVRTFNGTLCASQVSFVVKPSPIINFLSLSPATQCFQGNQYCFADSSTISSGTICKREYIFDDGAQYTFNGSNPLSFCHKVSDKQGGTFGVIVLAYSCDGCVTSKRFENIMKVIPALPISFNSPIPRGCDSTRLIVSNTSTVPFDSIHAFTWDWGDSLFTHGTKFTPALWGVQVSHWYKRQGPNNGNFDVTLSVQTHGGCRDTFRFKNAATNLNTPISILSNIDSACYSNPVINFVIKGGPIPQTSNPLFIYEFPPTPDNITRAWSGSHKFSKPGPHLVRFSYTSTIPGCGKTVTDTVLILGPHSAIELGTPNNLKSSERYQCVVKDTVHFSNFSRYYHNDGNLMDDDSVLITGSGLNTRLSHVFNFGNNSSINPYNLNRNGGNVSFFWDFDDEYCEPCTTDTKSRLNVNKNCRYSKDFAPSHLYSDYSKIYLNKYANKPQFIMTFNQDSGFVQTRTLWSDDSVSIIRDTILTFGDNTLGKSAKDSTVFNGLSKSMSKVSKFFGQAREDISSHTIFYLSSLDTAHIHPNDGSPVIQIVGPGYQVLESGQSLVLSSVTDTAHFVYSLRFVQDTIPKYLSSGLKIWKTIGIPGYTPGDSLNAAAHRQKFYTSSIVKCHEVRLKQQDLVHPMACASEHSVKLSLAPPSATYLRKSGTLCLGTDSSFYGLTFILDETKPGCGSTWASINPSYGQDSLNWVTLIGQNLSSGSMSMGELPPVNPPFLVFPGSKAPGNHFSRQYEANEINNPKGTIDVGLIIGNGIHPGGIYPAECQDTIIYKGFAKFAMLDPSFDIVSGIENSEVVAFCKKDPILVRPSLNAKNEIAEISRIEYSFTNANAGKYHDESFKYLITENYQRFKAIHKDSSFLMDYLVIEKRQIHKSVNKLISTQTIPIARIDKWHIEADVHKVHDQFKGQLQAHGLNINDFNSSELAGLIWNGKGVVGKAFTGSRGLVDTAGFGHLIEFRFYADSKMTMHKRDTSLTPVETYIGRNNIPYNSYSFIPAYSGFYTVAMSIQSHSPSSCVKRSTQKASVGFYLAMNFQDTIICPGNSVYCSPEFRYWNIYPEINTTNCPTPGSSLLDCTDYWRLRIAQAGNTNREGYTKHDLNMDDDGSDPKSIFGGWPYSIVGLDNKPGNILEISSRFGLYYNQDTGKTYIIRTAAEDSLGCKDTFAQTLYVMAPRAHFSLDQSKPECNTLIKLLDSSFIQDPLKDATGQTGSKIVKWTIDWGHEDGETSILLNTFPSNLTKSYPRTGFRKIVMTTESDLGCVSIDSTEFYIPGATASFDTFIPRTYCKGDTVTFSNESYYTSYDSCYWVWDFGDGNYTNQIQSVNSGNNPINYVYNSTGTYYPKLYAYYKFKLNNKARTCLDYFPNVSLKDNIQFININPCDSTDITSLTAQSLILMYPNPAYNTVQFESVDPVKLAIFNTLGQLIDTLEVTGNTVFDLRHLSRGIYLIKTLDNRFVGKLVID